MISLLLGAVLVVGVCWCDDKVHSTILCPPLGRECELHEGVGLDHWMLCENHTSSDLPDIETIV